MEHVLIVDDNAQNAYLLQSILGGNGYTVTTAANGAEALEKARAELPDMIVADILMPVMDGFELCRTWKTDELLRDVPFVFYTATYTDPRDEQLALRLGADRFIVKPQEPDVLLATLEEVLQARRLGASAAEPEPSPDETVYFKEYNEALIRKLEQKMLQLESEVIARREVEAVLIESEKKHRRLFETMLQGVIYEDPQGRITDANPAAERILGVGREQMMGRTEDSPHWRTIREDGTDYPVEQHPSMVALRTGCPAENVVMGVHNLSQDATRWIRIDAIPLFRPGEQTPYQVYIIFDDITERRLAELERERLMAAIEQTGDIVMITDPEGTIQYLNPAFETVTAYSRAEAIGQNPRMLKSGKHDEAFYQDFWETLFSGRTWTGRLVNKRKDGKLYTEEARVSPVLDALGRIVNYVAVKRDITEHLQLEQQFQQAMKMEAVGRLAGGVAHDFNNALTPLSVIIDILLDEMKPDDPIYDDVKEMERAAARCAALARQLLAFSRNQTMEVTVVNLNDVVANTVGMLSHMIGEDIELVQTLDPELHNVRADVGQVEQIIANLAVNARDAMPNGGRLVIETRNVAANEVEIDEGAEATPGPHVLLAVTDTGTGMNEETRARIFEPFFSTKEKGKGTGLGLSTVYGIVKQSGGSISVATEPGKGTSLRIYLPRAEDVPEEPKPRRPVAAPHDRGSETILLVEDDDSVRVVARRVLAGCGYEVLEAAGGEQALGIAEAYQGPIHLVITDVVMPGMSGVEMVDRIVAARPDIGVLYVSGYRDDTIANHGMSGGEVHLLQKPFTVEAFTAKVRSILDGD